MNRNTSKKGSKKPKFLTISSAESDSGSQNTTKKLKKRPLDKNSSNGQNKKKAKVTQSKSSDKSTESSCVVIKSAKNPPTINPSVSVLDSFLHPIKPNDFISNYWKKKAYVSKIARQEDIEARIGQIKEDFLHDLDLEALIEDTSSDNPFVWMRDIDEQDTEKPLTSMSLDSTESALICHRAGGSLYFRASEECEKAFLTQITKELGINFGGIFPTDNAQKAEIETFVSRKGHITPFHFDFMENFTIQISGIKKWTFLPLESTHPLRGATPHYKKQDTLEQQLKIHAMQNPNFSIKPTDFLLNQKIEVTLGPGDCFYFPAGMYHRTECLDEHDGSCLSINMSLISTNWCDVVIDGLKQVLLQKNEWRSGISNIFTVQDARNQLSPLLESLKNENLFQDLKIEDFIPNQGLILPKKNLIDFTNDQFEKKKKKI